MLPYSIQTDPSPIETESGLEPLTKGFVPVANTEETAVGSACADTLSAMNKAVVHRNLMRNVMISLHVMDGK